MDGNYNYSLLSSQARIQAPWIKVTIGEFTFGVFSKQLSGEQDSQSFYKSYNVQYPSYVQSLNITKINGQVNQYALQLSYPVRHTDDPNFFEKVFSSVSTSRKIVFSYGDSAMPTYVYKDEEAIITRVSQNFDIVGSIINYQVDAVSSAALAGSGSYTFAYPSEVKPSDEIKKLFRESKYGLSSIFKGMNESNLDLLIAGDDKVVKVPPRTNISVLDQITHLVSCMIPADSTEDNISKDIYILTLHDDTTYDKLYADSVLVGGKEIQGAYFKVDRTSYAKDRSDAYVIDIGYNTSTIVTSFQVSDEENYSLFYDYQKKLHPETYTRRISDDGSFEEVFAPTCTSNNGDFETEATDITWWTKLTKYPVKASITIQGLLRPANLMTYVRLNVIFPGGHKHISSGLYIVTQQRDSISREGYRTTLSLVKIAGDDNLKIGE